MRGPTKQDIKGAREDIMSGEWMVWPLIAAATLTTGPFSNVTVDNLMDVPMLTDEVIVRVVGEELLSYGAGMQLREQEGAKVVVAQDGFSLMIERDFEPGMYSFTVEAMGTTKGNDSYWLQLDGERVGGPFTIPVSVLAERTAVAAVRKAGKHRLGIVLREGTGSILKSVRLASFATRMPRAAMRQELIDQRPRLLITGEMIPRLRARLDDARVGALYKPAGVLSKEPPAFRPGKRNGGAFRNLGSHALSYLLQPDEKQLAAILQWLETATTYPEVGVDLDAEYFIEGIALTYDWLYEEIPPDLRQRVQDTIARQCKLVYEASLAGSSGGGLAYQQNHYWYSHLALALGAAALVGELPEAQNWLAWAWDRLERIALSFGPDGGFHEGPSYWDFSMPTLYLYIDLYEWCTGLRVPWADNGLRGQAEFRLHHVFPGLERTAPLEDTSPKLSKPPTKLLLWEAKRYQDPETMGVAHMVSRGASTDRFNLLWLDETLAVDDPRESIDLAKHYPDVENVFARTSWKDDATYLAFVCRPLGGHMYAELCRKYGIGGTGHNHPEQNHFVLFGRGELLADDPGYTYDKQTRNHNTVLVDGKGQYGDGEMWPRPNPGRAHITAFITEGDVTIAAGDAVSAYPPELGLTRFERTLVLAGRDLVVVCDRLAAGEPRRFSWLLHHKGEVSSQEGGCAITVNKAQLAVAPLLPEGAVLKTSTYRPQYVHPTRDLTPDDPEMNLLELGAGPATEATFLVPLLVGNAGEKAPECRRAEGEHCDGVLVGDTLVAFNRAQGAMTLTLPWGEQMTTHAGAVVARVVNGERQIIYSKAIKAQ